VSTNERAASAPEVEPTWIGKHGLLLVLAALCLANLGVWRASVPTMDDCGHVSDAFAVLRGAWTSNLYHLADAGLLATVAPDPITAHIVMRVFESFASTLGLYLVLRTFPRLRPSAVVIACCLWIASRLCTPTEQNAGVSMFTYSLALLGLAYFLRRPSANRLLAFMLELFWLGQTRPEYFALLIVLPVGGALLIRARRRALPRGEVARPPSRAATWALIAALLASLLVAHRLKPKSGITIDAYLLLGLGQCYAVYYRARHPSEVFAPMTEYQPLLDRVFGHPKTFVGALAHNPSEALRYVAVNTFENLIHLPRIVLANRDRVHSALVMLLFLAGAVAGVVRLAGRYRRGASVAAGLDGEDRARILTLVLFTSSSSVAIILLVPNARYWVAWAPLLYLAIAWAVQELEGLARPRWFAGVSLALVAAVFCFPVFWRVSSNQELFRVVRNVAAPLGPKPSVAGTWVMPYTTFGLSDRATSIDGDLLSIAGIENRTYDLFVVDDLENTSFWTSHEAELRRFEADPAPFGYRLLREVAPYGATIYVRTR
jgi:hypothetical protein